MVPLGRMPFYELPGPLSANLMVMMPVQTRMHSVYIRGCPVVLVLIDCCRAVIWYRYDTEISVATARGPIANDILTDLSGIDIVE